MTEEEYIKLNERIRTINRINDFDLAWRWHGRSREPRIEIYEEADRHMLCSGTPETIHELITESLPAWGLTETVMTKEGTNA